MESTQLSVKSLGTVEEMKGQMQLDNAVVLESLVWKTNSTFINFS
jgi:hypothetical protein